MPLRRPGAFAYAGAAAEIGKVDVLLLPVGGTFAISAAGAVEVRGQLQPAITIPMHYRTRRRA